MSNRDVSRRAFLGRLGACAAGGAVLSQLGSRANAATNSWAPPPPLNTATPNILVILVDQMRWPCWLNASQSAAVAKLLPNIYGALRNNSYVFNQYYAAATACTPSRATLLTGLYAPQTAMYVTANNAPSLQTGFPTWGWALKQLNYSVYWFGKWHLSDSGNPNGTVNPLQPYGFNTGNYPGGSNPSPNGWPNEGTNGGVNQIPGPDYGITYASDAQIAGDFTNWLQGPPVAGSPWCATVSFVNPHDIGFAPKYLPPNLSGSPWPPTNLNSGLSAYYPPPTFNGPPVYSALPSPWNFENQTNLQGVKPPLQLNFINQLNCSLGPISYPSGWIQLLNQYFWLQSYVDAQVGAVLSALNKSGAAGNTIVIFASDHGDYAGSHGMHDKAFGVYDEAIHVPLYIHFPGQTGMTSMSQMCSSVDFFRLICDLATGGATTSSQFLSQYPDQQNRQQIYNFIYTDSQETRVCSALAGMPYILHTTDEDCAMEMGPPVGNDNHVVCLRGKYPNSTSEPGAKLAVYSEWAPGTLVPDSTAPFYEFYNYATNMGEMGNDYANYGALASAYLAALGVWTPTPTGIIASELDPPLTGVGTDGKTPLSQVQAQAQTTYLTYEQNQGAPKTNCLA